VVEPFRDDLEAAHRRQAELERENAALKEELDRARRPPASPSANRWILPTVAATLALSALISYAVASRPRPGEIPAPSSAPTAPTPAASPTHVDFTQPGPAPDKDPWVQVPLPVNVPLYALAAGVDLTYAAGAKGTVLRRHSGEDVWSQEKTPTDASLHGIAIQMDHVVAVGERGAIVDLPSQSAREFRAVPSGTKDTLRAVAFSYLGPVAVGDHGTLLVDTTGSWTAEKSGTTEPLRAVCAGLQAIFMVGDHGTVIRRDGDRWVREESGTTADLHGVTCDDRKVVAVGAGGVVLLRDDPRTGFKVQKMGEVDLLSVDAYYGTSSWIAVGRGASLQRGMGAANGGGLHGDLYAVKQGSMGTCAAGESGLFLDARAP
jgi:hypothetical protein